MVSGLVRPVRQDVMSGGLEVKFSFPCSVEHIVPVSLVNGSNGTASNAYPFVSCYVDHVQTCGVVKTSSGVMRHRGEFRHSLVQDILGEICGVSLAS